MLEALAAEKPIVATKVGGIPEIFGAYAARLIGCDDPAALARAIVRALDEEAGKSAQSARALEQLVRAGFSLSRMADEAIAAYREALAEKA